EQVHGQQLTLAVLRLVPDERLHRTGLSVPERPQLAGKDKAEVTLPVSLLAEWLPFPIVYTDSQGTIRWCNQLFANRFAAAGHEPAGKPLAELFAGEAAEAVRHQLRVIIPSELQKAIHRASGKRWGKFRLSETPTSNPPSGPGSVLLGEGDEAYWIAVEEGN